MSSLTNDLQATFDAYKTLCIIEKDKDLSEIFKDGKSGVSYTLLKTSAKQGALPLETIEMLREIFERIILKNKIPLTKYISVGDNNKKPYKRKFPKYYGKKRILEDIRAKKTKTELDGAMLALNEMENIYTKLINRAIKDKINGQAILTTNDCRTIIAVVRTLENKVKSILKK